VIRVKQIPGRSTRNIIRKIANHHVGA